MTLCVLCIDAKDAEKGSSTPGIGPIQLARLFAESSVACNRARMNRSQWLLQSRLEARQRRQRHNIDALFDQLLGHIGVV